MLSQKPPFPATGYHKMMWRLNNDEYIMNSKGLLKIAGFSANVADGLFLKSSINH